METLHTELAARSSNVLSLASSLSRAVPNAISVSFNPCSRAALLDAAVLDIVDKLSRSAELLQSDRRVQSYDSIIVKNPKVRATRGEELVKVRATRGEEPVPRWKRAHIKVSVASIVKRTSERISERTTERGPEVPVEPGAVEVEVESRRTQEEATDRSSASPSEPCTESEPCTPQRGMDRDRTNASLPRLPYCLTRGSSMSSTMTSLITATPQPAADSISEDAPRDPRDAALTEADRIREEARTEIAISKAEAAEEIAISKAEAAEEIAISRAEAAEEIAISRAEVEEERARMLAEIAEMMTEAKANAESSAARIKADRGSGHEDEGPGLPGGGQDARASS